MDNARKMSHKSRKTSTQQQTVQCVSGETSSSIFGSRYVQNLLDSQPISLESKQSKKSSIITESKQFRVVQRLLPDVSLARHIVDSDDHAFASLGAVHALILLLTNRVSQQDSQWNTVKTRFWSKNRVWNSFAGHNIFIT